MWGNIRQGKRLPRCTKNILIRVLNEKPRVKFLMMAPIEVILGDLYYGPIK